MNGSHERPIGPSVSVVMRVYNVATHLREAIDSLLAQDFEDFEIIAVVGASKDDSDAIVASYTDPRIRIVRPNAPGNRIAAKSGLDAARGRYVAILDGDDIAVAGRLRQQAALLDADSTLVLVGGATEIIDERGAQVGFRRYPGTDRAIRRAVVRYNPFAHSAVMFRRDAAVAVGGYTDEFVAEDYVLWLQLLRVGTAANCSWAVTRYRVRTREPSSHVDYVIEGTIRARAAAFERFGYRRTLITRAVDLGLALLRAIPKRFVLHMFRRYFHRHRQPRLTTT